MQELLIGQYIDTYLPAIDGVIMTVRSYARCLTRDHCSCYVVAPEGPEGYVDDEPYRIIRYRSHPLRRRPPYRHGIPFFDWNYNQECRMLYPDLIHVHSPFLAGQAALYLARLRKVPIISTFHSKYYDDVLQVTGSETIAAGMVRYIVSYYNQMDAVWAVNNSTADTLRSYGYKGEIEIMPNGCDYQAPDDIEAAIREVDARCDIAPGVPVMLFVGQHIYEKNLRALIEAAAIYKREDKPFKLLMVGGGYALEDLKALAEQLGLGQCVRFCGPETERSRLYQLYARAQLFVFPSMYDNAPLVVREAAAAGCPSLLVAGSNAAEGSRDGYNAFLCADATAQSIAAAMSHALSDPDRLKAVGKTASETLSIPWRALVRRVFERYQQIIADHAHTAGDRSRIRLL